MNEKAKQSITYNDNSEGIVWILAFLAGLFCLGLLGQSSSLISRDDFYSGQLTSFFGDGRFIIGLIVKMFQELFGPDYYYRTLGNFLFGAFGYLALFEISKIFNIRGSIRFIAPIFGLCILSMAELVFWYDVSALSWAITFPILALWARANVYLIHIAKPQKSDFLFYGAVALFTIIILLGIQQVYLCIIIYLEIGLYFIAKKNQLKKNIVRTLILIGAILLGLMIYFSFINSGLYSFLFMPLRHLVNNELAPWVVNLDYPKILYEIGIVRIFNYTSGFPFVFSFLICIGLSAFSKETNKLALTIGTVGYILFSLLNPFIFFVSSMNNMRVFEALYTIAWLFMVMPLCGLVAHNFSINRENNIRNVSIFTLAAGLAAFIWFRFAPSQAVNFSKVLAVIFIASLIFLALRPKALNLPMIIILFVTTNLLIEWQKTNNHTERWQRDQKVDDALVDKFNDAILENFFNFSSETLTVEYGTISAEKGSFSRTLRGMSLNIHAYSTNEFLKNRLGGYIYKTKLLENHSLCDEVTEIKFQVIESKKGYLAICY